MGAVALGLIGFFAYITLRFNEVNQAPLYTGLSLEDSAAIVRELEAANVPYVLQQNGAAILVPDGDVTRLRMQFAQEGLPSGGGVGYEIFDKTDALGTTSFVQSVNRLRALEGELARTIRAISRVETARVHLVLPERQLFRREEQKPTASIVLKTRGTLEPSEIRAIQHLVASAVNGLEPSRISIVDDRGRLLAEGTGQEDPGMLASTVDERTATFQRQVEDRVREIVESVVGLGRARVKVAAEIDYNRISETRDIFDPEGQVVRSTQTREERNASTENQPNDQVTAGNQVPNAGANAVPPGPQPTATDNGNTSEETINYEISKTTRTQVTEAGGIKRLSVAVVVDGRYQTDAEGVQSYVPRDQAELDRISALVRTAMGYDQARGDQVEVVNLQFAEGPPAVETDPVEPGLFDFSKDDLMRFAEMGVMFILTLLVLLFAVRPLIRRILSPEVVTEHREITTTVTGPDGQPLNMVLNAEGQLVPVEGQAPEGAAASNDPTNASRIEEAKAKGLEQMDQIRRVGTLVEENPNEAALIIRNWLSEAA